MLSTNPRIVLCVDDDPDDRDLVCFTINEIDPSFTVLHAENGVEAISLLTKAKEAETLPCLVILDINMPLMDGKQTLAAIKKDQELCNLPVVLFSTSNNHVDKLYCEQYGVELVTKPSNLQSIKNEVQRLLHHCADA
jgi:CheY-like chemotaxis protein